MAVSIVARDSFTEPDDVGHSQIFPQRGFSIGAAQAGIAHLALLIEQAFLGGEQRAAAIDVNAAGARSPGDAGVEGAAAVDGRRASARLARLH